MTTRVQLCVRPGCAITGRHADDCPGEQCRGCLTARARDGSRLCRHHGDHLAADAHAAADLYDALVLALAGSRRGSAPGRSPATESPVVNADAVEARDEIRAVLVSWCRLVAEERGIALPRQWVPRGESLPVGFIGPPRLLWYATPDDTVQGMADYLGRHAEWLAAHPAAGDVSEELARLAYRGRTVAYPTGTRVMEVGPCPRCDGRVRALVREADALLPSVAVCSLDEAHRWDATQWHALGREIRRARGVAA